MHARAWLSGHPRRQGRTRRATRFAVVTLSLLVGCARARETSPPVVMPRGPQPAGDLSRGGTERGDVELAVGAVTTAVAGTLLGLGAYEAYRASELRRFCGDPAALGDPDYEAYCYTPLGADAGRAAIISSALAFAFAVPIAVGGGFLLRRGVATRKAWLRRRAEHKLSVGPWSQGQHGGGVVLRVNF